MAIDSSGAVYPSGGHGKRGKPRPGQWGWRARMLRARRLARAEARRNRDWVRRESLRGRPLARRADRRGDERFALGLRLCLFGLPFVHGETTKALRDRVLRAHIRASVPRGFTRDELAPLAASLSGGVVEVDHATATVRVTMPASTSAERCDEVRADIAERVPMFVAVEVTCAA